MASSSSWVDSLATSDASMPGWIAAAREPTQFDPTSPFLRAKPEPAEAEKEASAPAPAVTHEKSEWDRGYAEGEAVGRAAALAEAEQDQHKHAALRLAFRTLDQAALDTLSAELTETVIALCDAALGTHATDPEALQSRVAEAAQRFGTAAQSCSLHLNPDDLAVIDQGALGDWEVVSDSLLERGEIMLAGPDGAVRAGPAEWRRAIAAAVRG